jgi:hypothetical protein
MSTDSGLTYGTIDSAVFTFTAGASGSSSTLAVYTALIAKAGSYYLKVTG